MTEATTITDDLCVHKVRPRKHKRGADLISAVLHSVGCGMTVRTHSANTVGYAKFNAIHLGNSRFRSKQNGSVAAMHTSIISLTFPLFKGMISVNE